MSGGGVGPGSSLWSLSNAVAPWVDDEHTCEMDMERKLNTWRSRWMSKEGTGKKCFLKRKNKTKRA